MLPEAPAIPRSSFIHTKIKDMIVQFNTDHNIAGGEKVTGPLTDTITEGLHRYADHITRIEAHLSDENGKKTGSGDDKKCVLEARIEGQKPIAVTNHADTNEQAVQGAVDKLFASIAKLLDKSSH